ncbi:MAG: DMT family transporter [Rhodoferax sp.]|nr:DMT family transporter [Rhodoferax sp.]
MPSITASVPTPVAPSPVAPQLRERQGIGLMLAGGLLLGTLGVFVEEAGQHPLTTVLLRCAFGAVVLLVFGASTGRLPELRLHGGAMRAALLAGGLMVLNWALFFGAIDRTPIGVATVVFHVQPVWVMAFGAVWLGERAGRLQWCAMAAALAGLALASGLADGAIGEPPVSASYWGGIAMCLGGSLSYAGVTLIAKTVRGASPYALACWQCLVGVVLLAWWPLWHGWPGTVAAWAWLAGLGGLHTGLAYVILYAGMARLPAARIALLQFVYPGAAVLVDWMVYGRVLSAPQMAGVVLMALALWAVRRTAP